MTEDFEDITYARSTETLADLLGEFCSAHSLPFISADELLLEALEAINRARREADWLQAFITQWDIVQAEEDFNQAIAARGEPC